MGEDMIVPLEEDGDAVLYHQRVDGEFPARPFFGKEVGTFAVLSAPFEIRGTLDAAPAAPEDVVAEDKFPAGLAFRKSSGEPAVLFLSQGDGPAIARPFSFAALFPFLFFSAAGAGFVVHVGGGVPVEVEDHKEGISPRPGIVVPGKAEVFDLLAIAGVERVRGGQRKEVGAGATRQNGAVRGGAVQIGHGRLLMVTVDEKEGRGAPDDSQVRPLKGVDTVDGLLGERPPRDKMLDAEVVTHGDVEIGRFGGDGFHGPSIEGGIKHPAGPFWMGVSLEGKGEGAAGGSLGVEAALSDRCGGVGCPKTIVVPGVGFETGQGKFRGEVCLQGSQGAILVYGI